MVAGQSQVILKPVSFQGGSNEQEIQFERESDRNSLLYSQHHVSRDPVSLVDSGGKTT